jgi:hypothetical protein
MRICPQRLSQSNRDPRQGPIPGFAKTGSFRRLASRRRGVAGALTERAVAAAATGTGPVTLWAARARHPPCDLRSAAPASPAGRGDLGARCGGAHRANGPPSSSAPTARSDAEHLRAAADVLRNGTDVAVIPAEDGAYALIGMRAPYPELFADMGWSSAGVMDETRRRLAQLGLTWREPATLWDVDVPEDLARLRVAGLQHLIPAKT